MNINYIDYILLPLLIFLARIVDVSLGTVRIIFVSKGMKFLAPFLGFFEVLVWILAINKIMTGASNFIFYLAYAGGFSAGTYIGMLIEQKLSVGKVIVRIITHKDSTNLIKDLREFNHKVTVLEGEGKDGKVKIIFSIVDRKQISKVKKILNKNNPHAFYSIEDIRDSNSYIEETPKKFFGFYRKSR